MKNYKALLAKTRFEIVEKYGGDDRRVLMVAINNLLVFQRNYIKQQVVKNLKDV